MRAVNERYANSVRFVAPEVLEQLPRFLEEAKGSSVQVVHRFGEIIAVQPPAWPVLGLAVDIGTTNIGVFIVDLNTAMTVAASDGAIEGLRIDKGSLLLTVIGDETPVGICGSAVIDAPAQFYDAGDLTERGQIVAGADYVGERDGQKVFELAQGEEEVLFTQQDVRNLQLAKGAIAAGIEVLLKKAGLESSQLDKVVIASAFGAYINVQSAVTIGMLPRLSPERFEQVGNAAGAGVKLALLSHPLRIEGAALASESTYSVRTYGCNMHAGANVLFFYQGLT